MRACAAESFEKRKIMAGGEQAAAALQRVDDELTCAICSEPYQDPRLLQPCSHYYCKKCIDEYAARTREEGKELLCPECRAPIEVRDASALRPAHFLYHLRDARDGLSIAAAAGDESAAEASTPVRRPGCSMCSSPNHQSQPEATAFCSTCERFLCAFCVSVHCRVKDYDGHNITIIVDDPALVAAPVIPPSATVRDDVGFSMCSKHSDKKCEVFCSEPQCMEFICVQCAVTNHSGHMVADADEKCVQRCKRVLEEELQPMDLQCKQLSSVLAKIEARESEVSSQSSLVANRVHECFDQLAESLSGYKNRVLEQLYKIEDEKMSSLRAQKKTLKLDFSDFSTVVNEAEGILIRAKYQPEELLSKLRQILDRITPTVQQCATVDMRIGVDANVDLSIDDSLLQKLEESYCQVHCKLPDPALCTVSGYGFQTAVTGQETRFYLSLVYARGHPCTEQHECDIAVNIQPVATGEAVQTSTRSTTDGQYIVTYTPKVRGKHEIVVSVRGREIQGSPFQLLVAHHPSSLRPQSEKAIHVFCRMDGLTMSDSEQLVLSEKSKAEVSHWDKGGRKLGGIKLKSHLKNAKLCCPTGVEVDQHGHIYVADNQAHCLMKFNKEGSHLVSCFPKEILEVGLAPKGTHNKRDINSPGGIRINYRGEVLVCDCKNHRILIFDQDLNIIRSFGKKGEREGEFNWPVDMAIDLAGNVYVSDMDNHRIQVFNIKWDFIREFGTKGDAPGQLGQPTFIFLDRNGYLYISENFNHRVSVFRTTGEFVTVLASPTSQDSKVWFPKGITMDSNGLLYVADRSNQQIHVF